MKIFFILFSVVVVASAIKQEIYKLPKEKVLKAEEFGAPCAREHNIDPSMLPKIADGTLPRTEANNKYLYCFAVNAGFVDLDGHMVVDKMASLLDDHPNVEEFKEALRKCNEVTKENPIATIVEMNKCLTQTAPIRFLL